MDPRYSRENIDVNSKFLSTQYLCDENCILSIKDYIRCEQASLYEAINKNDIEIIKILLSRKDIDVNFKFFDHYNGLLEVDKYRR